MVTTSARVVQAIGATRGIGRAVAAELGMSRPR
ncbi:hypothetical protein BCF44_11746 [Kutzneria buriramensis]|uniref:Uncharacterized protein n=1 Tax=Kutzneria buriramensis TaxID=1045776 RepID=A0A3E0H1L4_9PSEU|nr:hypothetical protein BCF44_11746 [Kutzneria buriramensis]